MRDSDEFVRGVMAKRFIVGSGLAMALFCAWGFMETYAHVWHAPGWFIYPAVLAGLRRRESLHPHLALMKNRLKVLRAERGWTQEELSKELGVSRQAVNALETEKHSPSLDLAYRISAVFGVSVEQIFENEHGSGGRRR